MVPAVLAAGERLCASDPICCSPLALGYEIGSRIGIASKVRDHASARHLGNRRRRVGGREAGGASDDEIIETINIASSFGLSTSRRTMLEGGPSATPTRASRTSSASWHGSCRPGFVGEADGVGTVYGTVIADNFQPDEMVLELGERWEIARNYFKRHAACRYTHGALDALSEIVGQAGGTIDPVAIEAIEVDTYVWAAQLDSAEPKNMLAAKFSLPFALATFIVNGSASVPAFRGRLRPMRDSPRPRTARDGARGCRPDIDAAGPASGAGARPPH